MFGFSFDKRSLIAIFVALGVFSILSGRLNLATIILTLPGILVAISFHEFAHAWMAVKLGDDTPKYQGRLSLNPMKHMDPFGIMLLLFAGFGWGKPVQINPRNFKDPSKGEMLVSLAGPVMNFLIAFVTLIIMGILETTGVYNNLNTNIVYFIAMILNAMFIINVGLGVFNLIPLPPLDGSKIIKHFLPYNAKIWFEDNEQLFYIIFLVLWITRMSSSIISPLINAVASGLIYVVNLIFSLF